MCYTERPNKITSKLLYHKRNYDAMREEAAHMTWDADSVNNLEDMWLTFMNNIKSLTENHIPKSKLCQGKTSPIYIIAKARGKVKAKQIEFNDW